MVVAAQNGGPSDEQSAGLSDQRHRRRDGAGARSAGRCGQCPDCTGYDGAGGFFQCSRNHWAAHHTGDSCERRAHSCHRHGHVRLLRGRPVSAGAQSAAGGAAALRRQRSDRDRYGADVQFGGRRARCLAGRNASARQAVPGNEVVGRGWPCGRSCAVRRLAPAHAGGQGRLAAGPQPARYGYRSSRWPASSKSRARSSTSA